MSKKENKALANLMLNSVAARSAVGEVFDVTTLPAARQAFAEAGRNLGEREKIEFYPALPIAQVEVGPNVRTSFSQDSDEFLSLVESIRVQGLIQPVTVQEDGERLRLVAGERRLRACQKLGLTTVKAYVKRYVSEGDRLLDSLAENYCREDMSPMDIADACQSIVRAGRSAEELKVILGGRTDKTVSNYLRLARWPEEAKSLARRHRPLFPLHELLKFRNDIVADPEVLLAKMHVIIRKADGQGVSADQSVLANRTFAESADAEDHFLMTMTEELQRITGVKTAVSRAKGGRLRLIMSFDNREALVKMRDRLKSL